MCTPLNAYAAAEPLDWKTHGLMAMVISIVTSIILVVRNKKLESVHAKIMVFGIYFWVIVFLEASLYGLYYGFIR
jgi:uncharacterized membrane protein